ncbi:MAG: hypothetical protein JNK85_19365 [Verrucomicrobiales bacterium]|nr:hypothetical protein [Verrucomicrobiales bacterium]
MARAPRKPRFSSCTVLAEAAGRSHLRAFAGQDARPIGEQEAGVEEALPVKWAGKGWGQLLRPRLNLAWIGDQPVFLQLVLLPTDDPAEVPAMLELQLEKLSPVPVGQVVWSYEIVGQRSNAGLPVLLTLAERNGLERQLSDLERRGFCTDRLESPLVTLVTGTDFNDDGATIFVYQSGTRQICLVAWVADGVLRVLNRVNLAEDDRWPRQLVDELTRLAWAGELEGWSKGTPSVRLIADAAVLATWREPLEQALGRSIEVEERPADAELAAASVRRAFRDLNAGNLLPAEQAARYRQEFTDRLWMGGLLALAAAYLVCVLIYLGAVEVQKFRQGRMADQLAAVNQQYTNTLRLKAQAQVLQETVNLRYAALDCWLATVEAMPEDLSLENLTFSGGQSLVISGTAPADRESKITEFWQALKRKVVGNTNLFSEVQLRPTSLKTLQGVPQIQWSFNCRIQRPEI